MFTGSIYAGQEKMPDLPSMTDKMLKVLIEEAAGINALEDAYKRARENAGAAKVDLTNAQSQLSSLQGMLTMRENQLQQFVQAEQDWDVRRQQTMKDLSDSARMAIDDAKRLQAEAPQTEIDRLTNVIQQIDAKIAAVGQEQSQLQALSSAMHRAQMESASAAKHLLNTQNVAATLKQRMDQIDHKIGCPCGECGRPLTVAELATARANAEASLLKAEAEVTSAMTAADVAESAAQAAERAHDAFKLGMTDVSAEAAQRASCEAQRAALMQKDQQRQQVMAKAKDAIDTITKLKAETSPFASQIANQKNLIDTTKAEIDKLTGLVTVKQANFDLENEVVRVFSPAGVRARVLDEVTPYLNAQTSKYLSILSDGNIMAEWSTLTMSKAGEMKEKFSIDVTSGISAQTFKGLSGGEKRKVRVATALALQDLVATRATKPIDLFIADEVDAALDVSGLERLMEVFNEKARERGTLLVVSHNDLKEWISRIITVERTASGQTKISETVA